MGFDASNALRYSADQALAIPTIVGVADIQVWLVSIAGSQVSFGDVNDPVVTNTRLTVADGYRYYAPGDGYLNPIVKLQDTSQLIFSNGQLTNSHLIIGPLVLPYELDGLIDPFTGLPQTITGGTDPTLFYPTLSTTTTTELFVWVQGKGLSPQGCFYKIKEVILGKINEGRFYITGNMSNMMYRIMLEASGTTPVPPPTMVRL